jgi:predicted nucleotidyltransferase
MSRIGRLAGSCGADLGQQTISLPQDVVEVMPLALGDLNVRLGAAGGGSVVLPLDRTEYWSQRPIVPSEVGLWKLTRVARNPYAGAVVPHAEDVAARLRDLEGIAPDVELVVVFGSTVKGRARARSDVDVAVRCTGPADLDALYGVLAPRFGTDRLDLVDLRRASPLLMMELARSARVVYERRPGVYRQFQSLASRRYCDTAKLRRAQRRAIRVFLERHDLAP